MKLVRVFFVMCLISIAALPLAAQNGQRSRTGGRARTDCPLTQTTAATQPLDAAEAWDLLFMREEEKLARDLYDAFSSMWKVRIFSNIAASEERHFEAIKVLIDRYGLKDSALEAAGVFTNSELQSLYDELLAKGSVSLLEALNVGVAVENKDINDLNDAISRTKHTDVLVVYGNLLSGSINHLAAFNSHIEVK
jgi:hypothetical protein